MAAKTIEMISKPPNLVAADARPVPRDRIRVG